MTLSVKSANVRESTENVRVTIKNAPNILTFTNYPTRQLDFNTIFIFAVFTTRSKSNFFGENCPFRSLCRNMNTLHPAQ